MPVLEIQYDHRDPAYWDCRRKSGSCTKLYLGLGFSVHSEDVEKGRFIEQVTGLDKVKLKWVKMKLSDGSLLELLQYQEPAQKQKLSSYPIR